MTPTSRGFYVMLSNRKARVIYVRAAWYNLFDSLNIITHVYYSPLIENSVIRSRIQF